MHRRAVLKRRLRLEDRVVKALVAFGGQLVERERRAALVFGRRLALRCELERRRDVLGLFGLARRRTARIIAVAGAAEGQGSPRRRPRLQRASMSVFLAVRCGHTGPPLPCRPAPRPSPSAARPAAESGDRRAWHASLGRRLTGPRKRDLGAPPAISGPVARPFPRSRRC